MEDSYYEREADRTKEYHQANTHKISTSKLMSEQSRIRQLFDEDSNFKKVIQIDKYSAIGEVEDGVTNAIGDFEFQAILNISLRAAMRESIFALVARLILVCLMESTVLFAIVTQTCRLMLTMLVSSLPRNFFQ